MIINTNLAALNTIRQLGINEKNTQSSLAKLSSGLRINSAADDAAGLAISEKMRGQISGLNQASSNSQNAINMVSTAEGALNETTSILQRMRELAVQAGNDTNTSTDRSAMQTELNQLTSEINRIGNTTEFNTQKLLNATAGSVSTTAAVQGDYKVAAVSLSAGDTITIDGQTFTAVTSATANATLAQFKVGTTAGTLDATSLKAAIGKNTFLNAKYNTATSTASTLDLKQNASFESATAPIVSTNDTKAKLTENTTTAGVAKVTTSSFTMQIGANTGQTMVLGIDDMRSQALKISGTAAAATVWASNGSMAHLTATKNASNGSDNNNIEYTLNISDATDASAAVSVIDDAINHVSAERSNLGAYQNRLEHTINNLGTASQNITSAEANIRDVDMASEMTNFQKNNVLQQAAQAMLAQANQQPQAVLQLLR